MDLGAPAEEWYIFVGLSVVSFAMVGIVLGFPTTPPPDVHAVANTIDDVAGSSYNASGEYEHDAEFFWVDGRRIAMKNADGEVHESVRFGVLTPVQGYPRLETLLHGGEPAELFDADDDGDPPEPSELRGLAALARASVDSNDPEWVAANGTLFVRTIYWGGERVVLVDM